MNPTQDPTSGQPTPPTPPAAPPESTAPQQTPAAQQPVSQLSKPQPLTVNQQPTQAQPTPPSTPPSAPTTPTQPVAPPAPPPAPPTDTSTDDSSGEDPGKPLWRRILGFVVSWILIPAILVFFVHNFIFQAWYVDGSSMEPTFQNGNYLIVSKFETTLKKLTGQADKISVRRGDVVIFNPPGYPQETYFIKRAIGLPGEKVIIRNGTVRIVNDANPNGFVLNENYIGNIALEGNDEWTVPPGSVFVLGDNRNPNASQDSRFLGTIPLKQLVGIASLRLLPVNEFGTLGNPNYNAAVPSPTNSSPVLSPSPAQ